MKKLLLLLCTVFALLSFAQTPKFAPNRLIIKFKQKGIQEATEKTRPVGSSMVTFGIESIDQLNIKYSCVSAKAMFPENKSAPHPSSLQDVYILTYSKPQDIEALQSEYKATGLLEYAQPDFKGSGEGIESNVIPNDPNFSRNWDLNNDGTFVITGGNPVATAGADIKMECGWGVTEGDSNTIVAILDCGCQRQHPELSGRIWKNPTPGNLGYPDDLYGWDFAYGDSNVFDVQGHGTNVAGIIGANGNNATGYAGMNWYCKLMIVKVDDNNGDGFTSNWALGVTYAADNGANIINMSLESESDDSINDPVFQSAIDYAYSKGVLVVAAMGNYDNNTPIAPADMSHVMAVGATTTNDWRAVPLGGTNSNALPGSCYNTYISVVAPGDEINGLNNNLPDCYCWYWFGTSQACPHVVGLASLVMAMNHHLTNDQVQNLIEETADKGTAIGDPNDIPVYWNEYYGYGRINACRTLDTMLVLDRVTDLTNPQSTILLYPNPFSNNAELVVKNFNKLKQGTSIIIYDILGKEVTKLAVTGEQTKITRDGISAGLYFYTVTSGGEILGKGEIIITGN